MAATPARTTANSPISRMSRLSDMGLAVLILVIISMLIVPLPEWLLDTMLVCNIATAATILLVALYNTEPLQLSIFPSMLLVMTLFRLALNIAATKLILGSGHAGAVIGAFGQFVVGGSYIVGIIAFLILVVVQFVVITNGAGRVAEVAARFTLDAMPGKQMSIDADMNAGLITEADARKRRKNIEREADFYGAMDGASKFVRGDAVAAILIIINIIGGFALGLSRGGDIMSVLQQYTLLTIGEGLVSQVPALLISTATGLIVTRAASDTAMGQDFFAQLLGRSRPLMMVSGLLVILTFLPGFPKAQLIMLATAMGGFAWLVARNEKQKSQESELALQPAAPAQKGPESVMPLLNVETIELELGSNLVPLALAEEGGDLADRVGAVRKQIALELGIVLPTVRIRDNLQLPTDAYQIKLRGCVMAGHTLYPGQLLAMDSGTATQKFQGIETLEPAFGSPATWIHRGLKERAEMSGYIVADASSVLITHLTEVLKTHAAELLTRQETQKLIDHVKQSNAATVDELIPSMMTLGEVQKVLQALLRERVGIRDLAIILETLADNAPRTKDIDQLTELTRGALSRQICKQFQEEGVVHVLTLAPALEQGLRESIQATPAGNMLAIEPRMAQQLVKSLSEQVERAADRGYNAVLLCSGQIRLPLKRLVERSLPGLSLLAYTEIAVKVDVEAIGTVALDENLVAA